MLVVCWRDANDTDVNDLAMVLAGIMSFLECCCFSKLLVLIAISRSEILTFASFSPYRRVLLVSHMFLSC